MAEALRLTTDMNRVCIGGGLSIIEYRRVLAAIHNLVVQLKYQDIVLDFSQCTFTHAPPMIALISQLFRYREGKIDFELVLPSDERLARLFSNSNWAFFIDPNNFPPSSFAPNKHLPAIQFQNIEDHGEIVDQVVDTFLVSLTGYNRSHLKAIEWSLNEITDNVLVHSNSSSGGFVQVTAKKNRSQVEVVVADHGLGIPKTIMDAHRNVTSEVEAL